jgi:transcriptional regulator with GAF, ATPase, and Fis domain
MEKMRVNLRDLYSDLEQKVKDRTFELDSANQQLARSYQELEGRNKIAEIFVGNGELPQKAVNALDVLVTLSNTDWATLRLMRDSQPGLHLVAVAGLAAQDLPPIPVITESETLAATALTEGKIRVIYDYVMEAGASLISIEMGMRSLVILPVKVGERILGLTILVSRETNHFQPDSVDHLSSVVEGLGILVENALLHDISEKDRINLEELTEELFISNNNIVQANELLEQRVMIRTQELEAAN